MFNRVRTDSIFRKVEVFKMTNTNVQQLFYSPAATAKLAGVSRTTVYELNKKHHFIRKLGSRSLIRWADFEAALMQETEPSYEGTDDHEDRHA